MKYLNLIFLISIIGISGCQAKAPEQDERPCSVLGDKSLRDISRIQTCQLEEGGPEGVCLPSAMLPSKILDLLAECDIKNTYCVPKDMARYGANYKSQKCKSLAGVEGRCFSLVVQYVKENELFLPKDVCKEDELCAPCYHPLTGEATGGCTVAESTCDAPSKETEDGPKKLQCPYVGEAVVDLSKLPKCKEGGGELYCTQESMIDLLAPDFKEMLYPCEGGYCVPGVILEHGGNYVPTKCTSAAGWEGRCLGDDWFGLLVEMGIVLPQDICGEGEVCAPCYHPATGENVFACNAAPCDQPEEPKPELKCPYEGPPVATVDRLEKCKESGDLYCLPDNIAKMFVDEKLLEMVYKCPGGYCVPREMAEGGGNYVPPKCSSVEGWDGRCFGADWVADIAELAIVAPQDICEDGKVCAPCFHPGTGENTNACNTAPCDKPAVENPVLTCPHKGPPVATVDRLEKCKESDDLYCLPDNVAKMFVDEKLLGMAYKCPGGYCVPKIMAEGGGNYVPPTCSSVAAWEGRCLGPDWFADVAELASILPKDVCGTGEICAPCFHPLTNENTNACNTAPCDSPGKQQKLTCPYDGPPVLSPGQFPKCECGDTRCVPKDVISMIADEKLLDSLFKCKGGYCVPAVLIKGGGNYVPPTCESLAGAEGRCLSVCTKDVDQDKAMLPQDICPDGELCAPCFDPRSGTATPACKIAPCDKPKEDPVIFPECCGGLARCAPVSMVPAGDRGLLNRDQGTCLEQTLCVPLELTYEPYMTFPKCRLPNGKPGACLSKCVGILNTLNLLTPLAQNGCEADHLCVPCTLAIAGIPIMNTTACNERVPPTEEKEEADAGSAQ